MPLQITSKLGIQEDTLTGKIVGYQGQNLTGIGFPAFLSEAFIGGVAASLAQRRLWLAAQSGLYMIGFYMEVATAGAGVVFPSVIFTSPSVGAGMLVTQSSQPSMSTAIQGGSSVAWLLVRSAASDIFVQTTQLGTANLNVDFTIQQLS
jgi:hypothetical protein